LIRDFVSEYISNKAYPEHFGVVENLVPPEEFERRSKIKGLPAARKMISDDKFFSGTLFPEVIPQAKWLKPLPNQAGLAFGRVPPDDEKAEYEAVIAIINAAGVQICRRLGM